MGRKKFHRLEGYCYNDHHPDEQCPGIGVILQLIILFFLVSCDNGSSTDYPINNCSYSGVSGGSEFIWQVIV